MAKKIAKQETTNPTPDEPEGESGSEDQETPETDSSADEGSEETPNADDGEAGAAPSSDKDSSEEDESDSDDSEQPEDSVQSLVDAKLRTALDATKGKHGRQEEGGGSKRAYDLLFEQLKRELKEEITGKRAAPEGAPDISTVDVNNPQAVQRYLDQRITHILTTALAPIQQNIALRDADLELRKLASDHPDAHKYGKAMAKLIEQIPSLPLEYAYRIASSSGRVEEGVKKAYDNMSKKKKATLGKSTVKPGSESGTKTYKSKREAVLAALDETGASFND